MLPSFSPSTYTFFAFSSCNPRDWLHPPWLHPPWLHPALLPRRLNLLSHYNCHLSHVPTRLLTGAFEYHAHPHPLVPPHLPPHLPDANSPERSRLRSVPTLLLNAPTRLLAGAYPATVPSRRGRAKMIDVATGMIHVMYVDVNMNVMERERKKMME